MVGHGTKLGRKREEAIAALLTKRNTEEAAQSISIASKTLLRWLQLPDFKEAYRQARITAFRQSISRLQQAASAAVSTLYRVMVDPDTPASTKVRAAHSILDHAMKTTEWEDIEARVAELERAVAGDGKAGNVGHMRIAQIRRRLEALSARMGTRSSRGFTLEELGRQLWKQDQEGFRALVKECPMYRVFLEMFELEEAERNQG